MSQTAIEFQNVTKQFDNAALPSVDQVSLTIEEDHLEAEKPLF